MSSKFFGNSKVKSTQGEKNKKVVTPRASKRTTAVRKTGEGNKNLPFQHPLLLAYNPKWLSL